MCNNKIKKIEKAYEKIKNNYLELRKQWLTLDLDVVIDKCYTYQITFKQEIYFLFETIYENAEDYVDDTICDEYILDAIIKLDINWIDLIYRFWNGLDYERYNFFYWADLCSIVTQCVIKTYDEYNKSKQKK